MQCSAGVEGGASGEAAPSTSPRTIDRPPSPRGRASTGTRKQRGPCNLSNRRNALQPPAFAPDPLFEHGGFLPKMALP